MTTGLPLTIALFVAIGVAIGLLDLRALRGETRAYVTKGASLRAVALHAIRILATVGAFFLIARSGASHLLAASVGFIAARFLAVARARRST